MQELSFLFELNTYFRLMYHYETTNDISLYRSVSVARQTSRERRKLKVTSSIIIDSLTPIL
jgi:hypothetical protein